MDDNNEDTQQSDIEAICDAMSSAEQKAALAYLQEVCSKPKKDDVFTDDRQDDESTVEEEA